MKGKSDTFVIDSQHYENSYRWTGKACLALLGNKGYKKVIFKLNLAGDKVNKFNESFAKVMYHVDSVCIYGIGMTFFEDKIWIKHWRLCTIESLSIKDKITQNSFSNFCAGLKSNTSIKELTLKALELNDITELNRSISENQTLKTLSILCESRVSESSSDESLYSTVPSSNNSFHGSSHLLSDNSTITTYSLGGYLDPCPFLILGLIRNKTVKKLILENIDLDRDNLNIWSEMLKLNGTLKELDVKRGLNTTAAMILFSSLKKNKGIEVLKLNECTFGEVGFMVLQDLLRENMGIRKLEIKDLIKLRYNIQDENGNWKNLIYIINGLIDNNFVTDVWISAHMQNSLCEGVRLLAKGLKKLAVYNKTLISLRIEGLKLTGTEICGIVQGLEENTSLETCALCGSLIEWQDLCQILSLSRNLSTLKLLDLQDNKIFTYSDLEKLKGHQIAQHALNFMKECLTLLKSIKFQVKITSWLLEPMYYPAEIQQIVKSLNIN